MKGKISKRKPNEEKNKWRGAEGKQKNTEQEEDAKKHEMNEVEGKKTS